MIKFVMKILDTSRDNEVDVLIARDMLVATEPDNKAAIMDASKVIHDYYREITAFRREGMESGIEKLVAFVENGDKAGLEKFISENDKFFEESFKKAQNK